MVKTIRASCSFGFRFEESVSGEEETGGLQERNCYRCGLFYLASAEDASHHVCARCDEMTVPAQALLYRDLESGKSTSSWVTRFFPLPTGIAYCPPA